MKNKNLITGLLIIFVGVVALLAALNVFEFHWTIVLRLWPLMLIMFGITLLPLNDYLKGGLLLLSLVAGCFLYHVEAKDYHGNAITRFCHNVKSWSINEDDEEEEADIEYVMEQYFAEPYEEAETASIDIDFGAGNLVLKAPCAELVTVDANSNFVKYNFRSERGDKGPSIFVEGEGHTKHIKKKNENDLDVALCAKPVWNFVLDMGAANADLDFSPYKVSYVEVNGGACNLDLKLGDSGCNTRVEINTGASDIDIQVPVGVDCEVNMDSALTGKDLPGFEKVERGLWRTPGFGQGAYQTVINIDCAVSNISVVRY